MGEEILGKHTPFFVSGSMKEKSRHTFDNCAGIQSLTGALTQRQGHRSGGSRVPLNRGGLAGGDGKPGGDFERVVARLGQHGRK